MRFSARAVVLLTACWMLPGQTASKRTVGAAAQAEADPPDKGPRLEAPSSERLTFNVEWRLIEAGTAVIESDKRHAQLKMESAGIVSTLFKVHDLYSVNFDDPFCATSTMMDSFEGKRHHETKVTFDRSQNHATYLERDLLKEVVLHSDEIAIPNCVHEVITAFMKLRTMNVPPGQSTQLPLSDGRKSAPVKVEAQEREAVKTPAGSFEAIRYEANMLNGVIYSRKGRAFIWLTDDERRLPVQIRLRMQFPIGTVTLQLAKEEHF
ncbi:MAG TPA: DUF3108 domain-containing protein [Bryobacteraceae bacterium]|nr:DUF3108 domain-containing protein [Bryobacteraceae bacterium]